MIFLYRKGTTLRDNVLMLVKTTRMPGNSFVAQHKLQHEKSNRTNDSNKTTATPKAAYQSNGRDHLQIFLSLLKVTYASFSRVSVFSRLKISFDLKSSARVDREDDGIAAPSPTELRSDLNSARFYLCFWL